LAVNWRKIKKGSVYIIEFKGIFTGIHAGNIPFNDAELYVLYKGQLIHAWLIGSETDLFYERLHPTARSIKGMVAKYRRDAESFGVVKDFEVVATKVGNL